MYDIENDPRETNDLANANIELCRKMLGDLQSVIRNSKAAALSGEVSTLSDETKNRLRSLGYME